MIVAMMVTLALAGIYFQAKYPQVKSKRLKSSRIARGCLFPLLAFIGLVVILSIANLNVPEGRALHIGPWPWIVIVQFIWVYNILIVMRSFWDDF